MASKLNKLQGIPRIAQANFRWKDFHVRRGYAFGVDNDGRFFVSPGTLAEDGGLFLWIATDEKPVVCEHKNTVRGPFSRAMGGRSFIIRHGYYADAWSLVWRPSSIPKHSNLAQSIIAAKRKAKPCQREPYRGLKHLCPTSL